ncbi:MAG: carboxypeptidase-like regulatory domain-containing protein [Ignavibacteriae bacterium]|nr:carboxypeptidase-like regulatory domain-containing protein [Ignavibacteriota bacterium]
MKYLLIIGGFLFVVAILSGPVAFSQASHPDPGITADVRGIVSDSSNGERLIGVNVILKGTKRGATTNTSGFYTITNVPAGTHQLIISAVGYEPRAILFVVSRKEQITLSVRLTPQPVQTGEVVIQSAGISTLTERSASVHVMTPQEIRALPAIAQSDLLRSLQLLPGITSTSDVSAKFFVRGGASDQNQILLDGMKIHNPFHAFGLFSVLDPDLVRSAEVYTGAFPAGYGGRLSSVVNVTTKEGNLSKISGNATVNFLSGKLELDGPFADDNSWLVSGRTSLFSKTVNRLIPNAAPLSFYDLFVKGTMGTSTGRLGFRGFISSDDVTPVPVDQPDHSWRNAAASLVLSGVADDRLYFDATVNYSYALNRRSPKPGSTVRPAMSRLDEFGVRVELTSFTENQNTFFEGFEIAFPTIQDSIFGYGVFPKEYKDSRVNWSAWTRYVGSWGDLGFDLGIHADAMLLFEGYAPYQGIQPRLTLSYDLGRTWSVKASYGTFTQDMITISNEDDLITLFDAWIFLPDNLRPELARHYVTGIEGNVIPGLAVSLQGYIKDYSSLTLYNPSKVYPADPDYLNGDGDARGIEALIRFASPIVDIYTSYAMSEVTVNAGTTSYAPRYDRRHTIKAVSTFHLFDGFDLTFRWDFGTGYPFTQNAGSYDRLSLTDIATNPFPFGIGTPSRTLGAKNAARLPAYYRWDAGITYRITFEGIRGTAGVSLINLSDHKNILYYDRATGKTDYMIPFFPTAQVSLDF